MLQSTTVTNMVREIIAHQAMIIGPLAIEQANKVSGLKVSDGEKINIEIKGNDPGTVVTGLVRKYEELFGQASVEVCKDAIKEIKPPIPSDDLPDILR